MSSSSSTPATKPSTPTPAPAPESVDIDKLLNREANAFQRELEVERILKAFKFKCVLSAPSPSHCSHECFVPLLARAPLCARTSPYEILDIDETASAEEIKKKYRQLSLCEHPTALSVPVHPGA